MNDATQREAVEMAAQEVRTAVERFCALAASRPDLARPEVEDMMLAASKLGKTAIKTLRKGKIAA